MLRKTYLHKWQFVNILSKKKNLNAEYGISQNDKINNVHQIGFQSLKVLGHFTFYWDAVLLCLLNWHKRTQLRTAKIRYTQE